MEVIRLRFVDTFVDPAPHELVSFSVVYRLASGIPLAGQPSGGYSRFSVRSMGYSFAMTLRHSRISSTEPTPRAVVNNTFDFSAAPERGVVNGIIFRRGIRRGDIPYYPYSDKGASLNRSGILLREVRLKLVVRSRVFGVCCAVINFEDHGMFDDDRFQVFGAILDGIRRDVESDLLIIGDIPFPKLSKANIFR
jgi:hypothetical protein